MLTDLVVLFAVLALLWSAAALVVVASGRRQQRRRRTCPPWVHGPAVPSRRQLVRCLTCGGQFYGDPLDGDLWALSHPCHEVAR